MPAMVSDRCKFSAPSGQTLIVRIVRTILDALPGGQINQAHPVCRKLSEKPPRAPGLLLPHTVAIERPISTDRALHPVLQTRGRKRREGHPPVCEKHMTVPGNRRNLVTGE